MNLKTLGLVLLVPGGACAADLPEPVFLAGVGVNIHFTRGHEKDLAMIAAAGFKFVRMDFAWAATERRKGEYDWSEYDELTANLEKRGIRAYYILDYSNPLYEETVASKNPITGKEEHQGTASPQHPESIAAFARWAAAAAGHFHERRVVWEIWNEPNIFFWKPKPNVEQYTALALATSKGVSLETQAAFIARQQLSNLLNGVPISIWYDWKNDGNDPNENEHNFGTVTYDLQPKPAYVAVQTLNRELAGYRVTGRHEAGNEQDFVLVLTNSKGETKLAAWTTGEDHSVTLDLKPTSTAELSFADGTGERGTAKIDRNRFTIGLAAVPKYIFLRQAELK